MFSHPLPRKKHTDEDGYGSYNHWHTDDYFHVSLVTCNQKNLLMIIWQKCNGNMKKKKTYQYFLILIQISMYLHLLCTPDKRKISERKLDKIRIITKFFIRQANIEICPSFRELLYINQVSCPCHTAKTIIIWISDTGTIPQALIFAFLFGGRIWPVLGKVGTFIISSLINPSSFPTSLPFCILSHCNDVILTQPLVQIPFFHSSWFFGTNPFKHVQIGEFCASQLPNGPHLP